MSLATTPALQPPAGETSHFDGPYTSLQTGTVIAFGITCFLTTLFLSLRWFQTLKLVKQIEIDLVIITVSYAVAVFYFATIVNCVSLAMHLEVHPKSDAVVVMKDGWGKHMWDVSLEDLVKFNKKLLPNTLTYLICPSITKTAILSVLYRINPSFWYRFVVIAVGVAIFGYTLTLCAITGGPCNPLKLGTTKCLENVALAQAVLNIASDLAVIGLPIPTIHSLQLSRKQKGTIGCVLALGSGVIVCSIARLPYVLKLEKATDTTYVEAILGVWSIVEVNLGIVCSCAMRMKPLIVLYLKQLSIFSSRSQNPDKTTSISYPKKFRVNGSSKDKGSYQLHSIQRDNTNPFAGQKGISVLQSFDMDVQNANSSAGDSDSVEKILR